MDEFETHQNSLSAPALFAEPVSPSDSTLLTLATRAIYVGGAGDLRVRMASGGDVTFRPERSILSVWSKFLPPERRQPI